jgi:hypothetical protein
MPAEAMVFPLQHPESVVRHLPADAHTERQNYNPGLLARIWKWMSAN